MALTAGTRLGPYAIEGMLGAGGMGEVYKARDTRLDRTVAVKVLAPEIASDAAFKSRFEREARTISALNHPHICVLHDIGAHDGVDYLVFEHLEGQTLAERLQQDSRGLKLADALRIAVGVADALDAAHRHGVIHRDVKPGNIMLTAGGPKLLDFGLAKQPDGGRADAMTSLATRPGTSTAQGTIVGTLQYMAPEQIQAQPVDARTDIFALGAVLYEMVTGRKAFEAQSQASLIAKILETNPPTVSSLAPALPPALDHVVRRCLAKDPEDRWQTARDVLLELRWIQENEASGVALAPHPGRMRQWLPWAVAATAAILTAAAWALRPAGTEMTQPVARFDVAFPQSVGTLLQETALSPDGRHLAVATAIDFRLQLLLRRLDATAFVPLPGTEGARAPFWSPDGQSLAFFAGGKLRRIAVAGGSTLAICDVEAPPSSGSWGPNGVILFAMDEVIYRVPETGGTPVAVTSLDSARGDKALRFPRFLPDGQSFLLTVSGRRDEIHVGSLDSSTTKLVVPDAREGVFAGPASLFFMRGQSVVAVPFDAGRLEVTGAERSIANQALGDLSASSGATVVFRPAGVTMRQLQWFARDGRRLGPVGPPGPYQQVALSPSGKRVALQRGEISWTGFEAWSIHIWIMDVTTRIPSPLRSDPGFDVDPAWSPDERSVAFTGQKRGVYTIIRKDLFTGAEEPLAGVPFFPRVDEWTPDGRFVIFRDGRAIRALALSGDRTPRIILDTPWAGEDQSRVSPDGRWIAFNSNESGRWEVYVARFPDFTDKRPISNDGGVQPLWRRDGRELFYLNPVGQVMAVAIQANAPADFGVPRTLFSTGLNPSTPSGRRLR
jgi:Tol biopolymer transport system component